MLRHTATTCFCLALWGGCAPADESGAGSHSVGDIPIPELEAGVQHALQWALAANLDPAWSALGVVNDAGNGACPAGHAGEPPETDLAGTGTVGDGRSWTGSCSAGEIDYLGYMYWESAFTGDVADGAARVLIGDSTVARGEEVLLEYDGDARDSYSTSTTADGLSIWEYESFVSATVTGTAPYGADGLPGPAGLQEDLALYLVGGDLQSLEVYGNIYLYADLVDGRFDSVFVDLLMDGRGADADTCTKEPRGTIGIRDDGANWYYIQFAPKYHSTLEYENAPYSTCDGCGTAYFNGFEQDGLVCPDFSSLWNQLDPPDAEDFSL